MKDGAYQPFSDQHRLVAQAMGAGDHIERRLLKDHGQSFRLAVSNAAVADGRHGQLSGVSTTFRLAAFHLGQHRAQSGSSVECKAVVQTGSCFVPLRRSDPASSGNQRTPAYNGKRHQTTIAGSGKMRGRDSVYLFSDGDLLATLEGHINRVIVAVGSMPKDQFLATSIDTLVEHFIEQARVEPLVIYEDQMTMDQKETKINVTGRFDYFGSDDGRPVYTNGHEFSFFLPFSGDPQLWRLRPNAFTSMPPQGTVDARKNVLTIAIANTSNTGQEQYQQVLTAQLVGIRQYLAWQLAMISGHNLALPQQVRTAIDHRRGQIEQLQGLAGAFNIPMVRKSGMPEFRPIELPKRALRPLPRPPATGYKPEPAIPYETYEELLGFIRHAGASFESTPQTYMPMGEDGLRDIVLSHINVVYEGNATSETFRKYGKTDIRIEEESRSAFVGECKLWGGEKILVEALGQLLGYLTWRDCKAALIFFNKEVAGFTGVQDTIATALRGQSGFLREKDSKRAGEWRFVFQSAEDSAREVTVHVFAFNLYVAPARAGKKR